MGSSSGFVAGQLHALGMGTIGADDAMRALDSAMRSDDANVVVLPVLPEAAAVPMLADVAPTGELEPVAGGTSVGPGDGDIGEWVAQQVVEAVAHELGLSASDVELRVPLVETGVDSIMTVALRRALEKRTGLALPPTLLWEYPTAAAVSARIVELCVSEANSVSQVDAGVTKYTQITG
jgi:6-methylsalicylic acid synthase